jgi:CheY-like chemotaxis protein
LNHGFRLLSADHTSAGNKLSIITEADRSSTYILLPERISNNSGGKKCPKSLVAEDDSLLARYYTMLLSQQNCEMVLENTGPDAILRAVTFQPDVALLGAVPSEISGVEAAIKLLEICPGTKIVLVSVCIPPKTLEQLAAQGYRFPTLPAPFTREELHALVFGKGHVSETR